MTADLTIITVCYNSKDHYLAGGWQHFLETTDYNVIIVDNGSPDNSGTLLTVRYPCHTVLLLGRNIGYGRAANAGIEQCTTRFALLLNPDLTIDSANIARLLDIALQDKDATAIWAPALSPAGHTDTPPQCVQAVSGAAMLFDLGTIKERPLFDANIFLYSEETDLCHRVRHQDLLIKLCPRVFVDHQIDGSSGHHQALISMKSWHFAWSRCYFLCKHNLATPKRNPKRMYRYYKLKSYISLDPLQRLRYRAQAQGVRDFLRGKKAFTTDGLPQMLPKDII